MKSESRFVIIKWDNHLLYAFSPSDVDSDLADSVPPMGIYKGGRKAHCMVIVAQSASPKQNNYTPGDVEFLKQ